MVDALAPDRSDQSFSNAIPPRCAWCDGLVTNTHRAQSACDDMAVRSAVCSYRRSEDTGNGGLEVGAGRGTDNAWAPGSGGAFLRGGEDILCLMFRLTACGFAMFWAICSCLAASCSCAAARCSCLAANSSTLRCRTVRSRAIASSCCTNSGDVAGAVAAGAV